MNRWMLLLLLPLVAMAQTTTVTGTIVSPTRDKVSGSCSIQAVAPFSTTDGWRVVAAPTVVSFTDGTFSAALAPTDTATPSGQYYRVTCQVPLQKSNGRSVAPITWGPRYWLVPTSAYALDIGQVETAAAPPSTATVWILHPGATWDQLQVSWDSM